MFTAFEAWLVGEERSQTTIRGYLADLRMFARWFKQSNGSDLSPTLLTPSDVREYRAWMQGQNRAVTTIHRHIMALRAYARWAQDAGFITDDPAARVRIPGKVALAPRWLSKPERWQVVREAEAGVAAANTPERKRLALRDLAAVVTLLNTGLRVSEICALNTADCHLADRSGFIRVADGKGNKTRDVPLNANAREVLHRWLSNTDTSSRLFAGITPSGLQRRVQEIGRRAGVDIHPHTLRHTFAKTLVDAGASMVEVAAILGHSSLNTTRIYVTPGARDLARAAERLEE